MMAKFEMIGRVARVTDLRDREGATQYLVSLATTKSWKDQNTGEWKDKPFFHTLTVYRGMEWLGEKIEIGDLCRFGGEIESWSQEEMPGGWKDGVTFIARERHILHRKRASAQGQDVPPPDYDDRDPPPATTREEAYPGPAERPLSRGNGGGQPREAAAAAGGERAPSQGRGSHQRQTEAAATGGGGRRRSA
jgi:hypothetical protein